MDSSSPYLRPFCLPLYLPLQHDGKSHLMYTFLTRRACSFAPLVSHLNSPSPLPSPSPSPSPPFPIPIPHHRHLPVASLLFITSHAIYLACDALSWSAASALPGQSSFNTPCNNPCPCPPPLLGSPVLEFLPSACVSHALLRKTVSMMIRVGHRQSRRPSIQHAMLLKVQPKGHDMSTLGYSPI